VPVPGLDGDWTPRPEDRLANLARLSEKYLARPDFYRYYGQLWMHNVYHALATEVRMIMENS
jgi:uncharacterized Zn finger protein